eukprot:TRINITY_DN2528_c0_g1_i2.p1 TRINITY_DN2528_c0_g1~~TRINITY_DN2528_c0_g1_i2.p1  ORF type:complete len:1530 (+),score=340.37 TRINITY_DN2528_c0_g1_i2:553-4590(+)
MAPLQWSGFSRCVGTAAEAIVERDGSEDFNCWELLQSVQQLLTEACHAGRRSQHDGLLRRAPIEVEIPAARTPQPALSPADATTVAALDRALAASANPTHEATAKTVLWAPTPLTDQGAGSFYEADADSPVPADDSVRTEPSPPQEQADSSPAQAAEASETESASDDGSDSASSGGSSGSSGSSGDIFFRRWPGQAPEAAAASSSEASEGGRDDDDDVTLRDFLRSHFASDPAKLLRAETALEREGLLLPPRGSRSPQGLPSAPPAAPGSGSTAAPTRFGSCFKEVGQIGAGGQGRVWQVQSVLDGRYYAIKRVPLAGRRVGGEEPRYNRVIFKEVQTLAKLKYHPYIVRYYTAWDESTTLVHADTSGDLEGLDTTVPGSTASYFSFSQAGSPDSDDESSSSESGGGAVASDRPRRFLYIQMEFCTQDTLRQAIDRQVFTDARDDRGVKCGVRILRQLLTCVAYIHQNGVIHRDLKPENIFFDFQDGVGDVYSDFYGDIKVGDFGLATDFGASVAQGSSGRRLLSSGLDGAAPPSHHSQGIGTPLYCAPEQMSSRQYNEKVDLYSVGIIAYEMFAEFASESERYRSIIDIRDKAVAPEEWRRKQAERALARLPDLVDLFLSQEPSQRPDAANVLDDDFLPPDGNEPELSQALRTFERHTTVMSKLMFERSVGDMNGLNVGELSQIHWLSQTDKWHIGGTRRGWWLRDVFSSVFRAHGGVEVFVPVTVPLNWIMHSYQPDSHHSMDEHGHISAAPSYPPVAFARWLATPRRSQLPVPLRRFSVANMSQQARDRRDGWRRKETACFDIVTLSDCGPTETSARRAAVDADVLLAACAALCKVPLPRGAHWCIRLSHTALLGALFAACHVTTDPRRDLFRYQLDRMSLELRKKGHDYTPNRGSAQLHLPPAHVVRAIPVAAGTKELVGLRDDVSSGRGAGSFFGPAFRADVTAALRELCLMEECLESAAAFRSLRDAGVLTAELDMCHTKYHRIYQGCFFAIELRGPANSSPICVGLGGRYDAVMHALRKHYQMIAQRDHSRASELCAVPEQLSVAGVCFSLPDVAETCLPMLESPMFPGGAQVHICVAPSTKPDPARLLACAEELRQQGIRADWQPQQGLQVSALQEHCRRVGAPWLLMLPRDRSGTAKLKRVKNIYESDQKQRAEEWPLEAAQLDTVAGRAALGRSVAALCQRNSQKGGRQGGYQPSTSPTDSAQSLEVVLVDGPLQSGMPVRQISSMAREAFAPHPVPAAVCLCCDRGLNEVRSAVDNVASSGDGRCPAEALTDAARKCLQKHPAVLIWADHDFRFHLALAHAQGGQGDKQKRRRKGPSQKGVDAKRETSGRRMHR